MENKFRVSIEEMIAYFGEPEIKGKNHYKWQCPYCEDSHHDNLVYTIDKELPWCFAEKEHNPLIREYIKLKRQGNKYINPINNTHEKKEVQKMKNFIEYVEKCNKFILDDYRYTNVIYDLRGISKETIEVVKIGFDDKKKLFVIPNIKYTTDNEIFVFSMEYRDKIKSENKKVTREKNTPTGLNMINTYNSETEALVVVEGPWDGYALYDFLRENRQEKYYHIVAPSNGATTTYNQLSEVEFSKYKRFYLYLDNDVAGNAATAKILEKYKMFENIKTNCSCKDFNEHFMNCIKKSA